MNRKANRHGVAKRSQSATALAELPLVIWLVFSFFLFPLLIFSSLAYRATLVYFATDSATHRAAKAATYTDAVSRASSVLTTNLAPFTGISATTPTLQIMVQPTAGGTPTYYKTKLAPNSVDVAKNLYFIISTIDADLDPLVNISGNWMGLSIPGLTGPYHLKINTQAFVENASGLTQ